MLIKLIEFETRPSLEESLPVLPNLDKNIFHGNSLVDESMLSSSTSLENRVEIVPFNWHDMGIGGFDAIVGNPPYVCTEDMHALLTAAEFAIYKKHYESSYKQFDKYFIFLERAIKSINKNGYVCYIMPNKFYKIPSGTNLRRLIANKKCLVRFDDFGDVQLFPDKTIYSSIIMLKNCPQSSFIYSNVKRVEELWEHKNTQVISLDESKLSEARWWLTTDFELMKIIKNLENTSVPITKHIEAFNGIQTSAERPKPIYWFTDDEVTEIKKRYITIQRNGKEYDIEQSILRPYFKPAKKAEKGLNSYSVLSTDKHIIFPYDSDGKLIPLYEMKKNYPGAYTYLLDNYSRLVPKNVSKDGTRDVPNATPATWYQYGRTQALTVFTNTRKLIVGVLSKEPMYALDERDMLIASGGTAGYCAVKMKESSPYALEYMQAWLSNPYTEKLISVIGSYFEGGFVARGTAVLSSLPFVELDLNNKNQKELYDRVIESTKEIYQINTYLVAHIANKKRDVLIRRKAELIKQIESIISRIYRFEF